MPSSCLGVGCCVGSYTRCCRHVKESRRKTTKLAGSTHRHGFPIPIDFPTACIPVVLSYLFAYSHNLTHSCISSHPILPYRPQAPKNPTSNQARPAFPAPQTRHPRVSANSLRRLPARYRMSRRDIKSAETNDRLTRIHASDQLTQILCADEGGMDMASLRDATTGALRSSRPEGLRLRPRAWIPEESGQVGFNKSP